MRTMASRVEASSNGGRSRSGLLLAEFLRREAHDEAKHHAGEHDVPEKRHAGAEDHEQAESGADDAARENAEKHRLQALRNVTDGDAGDEAFQQREGDDLGHDGSDGGLEEAAEAIEKAEGSANDEPQHRF